MKSFVGVFLAAVAHCDTEFAANMLFGQTLTRSGPAYTVTGADNKVLTNGQYPRKSDGTRFPIVCGSNAHSEVFKIQGATVTAATVEGDGFIATVLNSREVEVEIDPTAFGQLDATIELEVGDSSKFTFRVGAYRGTGQIQVYYAEDTFSPPARFVPIESADFGTMSDFAFSQTIEVEVYNKALECPAYLTKVAVIENEMKEFGSTSFTEIVPQSNQYGVNFGSGVDTLFDQIPNGIYLSAKSKIKIPVFFAYKKANSLPGIEFKGKIEFTFGSAGNYIVDTTACVGDCSDEATVTVCEDVPGWLDVDDYGCGWFNSVWGIGDDQSLAVQQAKLAYMAPYAGCDYAKNGQLSANEACCVLGGGVEDGIDPDNLSTQCPVIEEQFTPENSGCKTNDLDDWMDGYISEDDDKRYGCGYYVSSSRCEESKFYPSEDGTIASEVCCTCLNLAAQ